MFIVYFIFNIFGWTISKLPFWFLYLLSDIAYFKIYYLFGYRKKVTLNNLRNSFPEKSDKEIKRIARKFYRNLTDLMLETLKIRNFSFGEQDKRIVFRNFEIVEEFYKQGKSVFASMGHCGNWEWVGIMLARVAHHHPYAIFKPLNNPYFNNYMSMLRTKSGYSNLIRFKQTYRTLVRLKHQKNIAVIASDQTPTMDEINYWTTFFHQETGFFLGLEKMSKALDYAVVFMNIQRVKRGYYEITFSSITDNPKETKEYEITDKYVKLLENSISKNPDNWLWSHRRWKHKKPEIKNQN